MTRPLEGDRFEIAHYGAGLAHTLERPLPVLGASAGDRLPAEMDGLVQAQRFEHCLHHADVRFDAGDHELAIGRSEAGAQLGQRLLEARLAEATEGPLLEAPLRHGQAVESVQDFRMRGTEAARILLGQHDRHAEELGELEQAVGRGEDESGSMDFVDQLSLQVDDHQDAAVDGGELEAQSGAPFVEQIVGRVAGKK